MYPRRDPEGLAGLPIKNASGQDYDQKLNASTLRSVTLMAY